MAKSDAIASAGIVTKGGFCGSDAGCQSDEYCVVTNGMGRCTKLPIGYECVVTPFEVAIIEAIQHVCADKSCKVGNKDALTDIALACNLEAQREAPGFKDYDLKKMGIHFTTKKFSAVKQKIADFSQAPIEVVKTEKEGFPWMYVGLAAVVVLLVLKT